MPPIRARDLGIDQPLDESELRLTRKGSGRSFHAWGEGMVRNPICDGYSGGYVGARSDKKIIVLAETSPNLQFL